MKVRVGSSGFSRGKALEPESPTEGGDRVNETTAASAPHTATTNSSPGNSRRSSLKEAWASIKKVVKKRASLPDFLHRRNSSPSAPKLPAPQRSQARPKPSVPALPKIPSYDQVQARQKRSEEERRRREEEARRAGDCIVELMTRIPKYQWLLARETREQLVREGQADPSILYEEIEESKGESRAIAIAT